MRKLIDSFINQQNFKNSWTNINNTYFNKEKNDASKKDIYNFVQEDCFNLKNTNTNELQVTRQTMAGNSYSILNQERTRNEFYSNDNIAFDEVLYSDDMKEKETEWQNIVDLIIRNENIEFCEKSFLEEYFIRTIESFGGNKLLAEQWILNYYMKNADNSNKVIAILHAISRIPIKLCGSQIVSLVGLCLSSEDPEIVEFALKVFENWKSVDLLPFLRSRKLSYGWLNSYLQDIIRYIEEED